MYLFVSVFFMLCSSWVDSSVRSVKTTYAQWWGEWCTASWALWIICKENVVISNALTIHPSISLNALHCDWLNLHPLSSLRTWSCSCLYSFDSSLIARGIDRVICLRRTSCQSEQVRCDYPLLEHILQARWWRDRHPSAESEGKATAWSVRQTATASSLSSWSSSSWLPWSTSQWTEQSHSPEYSSLQREWMRRRCHPVDAWTTGSNGLNTPIYSQ